MYTERDLISFGKYLLSIERVSNCLEQIELLAKGESRFDELADIRLSDVTQHDILHWKKWEEEFDVDREGFI